MINLCSPTGRRIVGTHDLIPAVSYVNGFSEKGEPVFADGSDIDWNAQAPVLTDGVRTLVDEDGKHWPQSQCVVQGTGERLKPTNWTDWTANPFEAIKTCTDLHDTPADYDNVMQVFAKIAKWDLFEADTFLDDVLQEIGGAVHIIVESIKNGNVVLYRASYSE